MDNAKKTAVTQAKAVLLEKRLIACDLCPRNCGTNRLEGKRGFCGVTDKLLVYTAFLHRGEEPAISGRGGSGTIFFSGCNLRCVYCQNYTFSHYCEGRYLNPTELATLMLNLQKKGADNINLVTPTHFLPQILRSLAVAFRDGLAIPIVYNTSGYEKEEIITQLEDIIDIYLVDMRYMDIGLAQKYSAASDYPFFNQDSLKEMQRQKSEHLWDKDLLREGCIIRHLVLPGHLEDSKNILKWIKDNVGGACVSIMFQYRPYFKADRYPKINRALNTSEYNEVAAYVEELGLSGWLQEYNPQENLAGVHFKAGFGEFLT